MGQNSPKDITCLTVFFCIMIVLLPLIGVLQQWHLSCFQNRQKEKEYQAKQETDEKMKTWLLAREAIIKDTISAISHSTNFQFIVFFFFYRLYIWHKVYLLLIIEIE